MATKAKTAMTPEVCASDAFLGLPFPAQALYLHINVNVDAYGVVVNPGRLLRGGGYPPEALDRLIESGYVARLSARNGEAIVVTHYWQMNKLGRARLSDSEYHRKLASSFVFVGEGGRDYVPIASIPECDVEEVVPSEVPGIRRAILRNPEGEGGQAFNSVTDQSLTSAKSDANRIERNRTGIEKETKGSEEEKGTGKGTEAPKCPQCGNPCPAYEEGGYLIAQCPECGTFQIDRATGEVERL